jgi:hypothetical protein
VNGRVFQIYVDLLHKSIILHRISLERRHVDAEFAALVWQKELEQGYLSPSMKEV